MGEKIAKVTSFTQNWQNPAAKNNFTSFFIRKRNFGNQASHDKVMNKCLCDQFNPILHGLWEIR